MRHMVMVFLTVMAISSCDNLFYHDMDPVEPAPVVLSVFPPDNSTDVFLNTSIIINFSGKMNLSTINKESIIVKKITVNNSGIIIREDRVDGTVTTSEKYMDTAMFSLLPDALLEPQQLYVVMIKRHAKALSGKRLDDEVVTRFTTGGTTDEEAPKLVWISPEYIVNKDNKINNIEITIQFDEPIKHQLIQDGEISLTDLSTGPGFGTIIFSKECWYTIGKPDCIVIRHNFNFALAPDKNVPKEYRIDFCIPSSIQDFSGNSFNGEVVSDLLYPRDIQIIKHLWSHKSPVGKPCWLSGEDSECGQ